jgi:outer membrane lipoprotein-sorting protein
MISKRLQIAAVILSAAVVGCGGAEPKKITPPTAEQKAELDKAHQEMKAKMEAGTTSGGAAEPPKQP